MPSKPAIILKSGRDKSARAKHPWIFSGAIERVSDEIKSGDYGQVLDKQNNFVAWGFYNTDSQIAVRLCSWRAADCDPKQLIKKNLQKAWHQRVNLFDEQTDNCYRLVFAESDHLPGLVVDRYADYLVLQVHSLGMQMMKDYIVDCLRDLMPQLEGVFEKSEPKYLSLEGYKGVSFGVLWGKEPPDLLTVLENNHQYLVDIKNGQKTGLFLDQKSNRRYLAGFARGKRVLNCFSYTGGFGLEAALSGADQVLNIDSSDACLQIGQQQAELVAQNVDFLKADVSKSLDLLAVENKQFDLIILDPPKYAESAKQIKRAARAYKDLNRRAMKLLPLGGYLATFSCSGAVDRKLFGQIVWSASLEAGADFAILEELHQSADHPVLLSFPESRYLKGLFLQRVS
ncbi:MAG TPA: class I SAM-dependent rRNA methyltransferase [Candidatus Wirthbacteria bacterium]|nr:class I SAM-dependent rRNA methyltransferase [Candidatus Wirthbacteria bacterium]